MVAVASLIVLGALGLPQQPTIPLLLKPFNYTIPLLLKPFN